MGDPDALPTIVSFDRKKSSGGNWRDWRKLWGFVITAWFCIVFAIEFVVRCLCVRDRRTAISGGAGVEQWPRKMATARFRLEDMKMVKKAVANAVSRCKFSFSFFFHKKNCHKLKKTRI